MAESIHWQTMLERYQNVRRQTETLCAPLAVKDYVIQSMPDASPARWHLAHTTWFFETFVLAQACPGYTRLSHKKTDKKCSIIRAPKILA